MAHSQQSIKRTLKWEGIGDDSYTNDPDDPGGPTRYGIIESEARIAGYSGDMKDFSLEMALQIYKRKYWDLLCLDKILDQEIADQIFQAAVNQGVPRWKVYIQQICNHLLPPYNRLLLVDGVIGDKTLDAINQIAKSNRIQLSQDIRKVQEKRYDEVVTANVNLQKFRKGWSNRAFDFVVK